MSVQILHGNCVDLMAAMEPESIHACVTSPPYWGLRDYGTAPLEWPAIAYSPMPGLPACVEIPQMRCSLGLDPTLEAFIGHMVLVFRGVHRVLRDDGTAWVNMGDSYAGSRCGGDWSSSSINGSQPNGSRDAKKLITASRRRDDEQIPRSDVKIRGLKEKDLVGQPWRLAFALQADGWWLRQDVIWSKLNPMPESAKDRCTKSHEDVFLLAKSKRYYWDFAAMQEPASAGTHARLAQDVANQKGSDRAHAGARHNGPMKAVAGGKVPAGWANGTDRKHDEIQGRYSHERKLTTKDEGRDEQGLKHSEKFGSGPGWRVKNNESFDEAMAVMSQTRNKRSVWANGTEPCKEAHFATFPTELIRPCIEASCPIGGTVLDPFGGAGTTGMVADRLGRNAVLCELNPDYIAIGERRVAGDRGHVKRQISLEIV
jgi:DNA modification methylase